MKSQGGDAIFGRIGHAEKKEDSLLFIEKWEKTNRAAQTGEQAKIVPTMKGMGLFVRRREKKDFACRIQDLSRQN